MQERYVIVADWAHGRDVYLGQIFTDLDSALLFVCSEEWAILGADNYAIKPLPLEVFA